MDSYIDNYVGEWEDKTGNRLSIRKVDDETCVVSLQGASESSGSWPKSASPWTVKKPPLLASLHPRVLHCLEQLLWRVFFWPLTLWPSD